MADGFKKEGLYYYAPHKSKWGVWRAGKVKNNVQMADFIADFSLKAQAESFVYKMNGWRTKHNEEKE